jgi:hypothetical protein
MKAGDEIVDEEAGGVTLREPTPGVFISPRIISPFGWRSVWQEVSPAYSIGCPVSAAIVVCLVLPGVLLGLWRFVRQRLLGA